jgi:hypothetical protein
MAYIDNLQRSERLIVVDSVSFVSDPTNPANLSLDLSLRAFTDADLSGSDGTIDEDELDDTAVAAESIEGAE